MYILCIYVVFIEICGCVVVYNKVENYLIMYMIIQVLYVICMVIVLVVGYVGLMEEKICVILFDIGGGFGGKVFVYFGYVIVIVVFFFMGVLIKWVEDCSENLQVDFFVCDYYIIVEMAGIKDGKIQVICFKVLVDYGYMDVFVNFFKFLIGLFFIGIGLYDYGVVYMEVDVVYINKFFGGVVYCCFFWVMEVVYVIECMIDVFVCEVGKDFVQLWMENFIKKEDFFWVFFIGWFYDSGDYYVGL